jgi:hypothetical protein|tara:strand:- start:70 stop:351 length:282 start_codon:yes stop_codon:yes gene_type:complete
MNIRRNTLQHIRQQCRDIIAEQNAKIEQRLDHRLPAHVAAISPGAADMESLHVINQCLDKIAKTEQRLQVLDRYDYEQLKEHDDRLNYDTYSK